MSPEPRKLKRPERADDDPFPLAQQYMTLRNGREGLAKNEDKLKQALMAILADMDEGENGHRFYYFPQPLELNGKPVYGFKRERRAPQALDVEKAMELVKAKGLEAECVVMVPELDEDALLAASYEGKITDEEMKALYVENESFAFVLVKEEP